MAKTRTPAQEASEAARALHLHQLGMTEAAIADRMTAEGRLENPDYKISQPTVHRRIQHALEMFVVPAVAEAQRVEVGRLDAYLAALAPKLVAGDVQAIKTAVSIQERRAKLMGLDAAKVTETKHQVTGPQPVVLERLRAARELEASRQTNTVDAVVVPDQVTP